MTAVPPTTADPSAPSSAAGEPPTRVSASADGSPAPEAAPAPALSLSPEAQAEFKRKLKHALSLPRGFNLDLDLWGRPFWQVMHSVTFRYPVEPTDEHKQRIIMLFSSLPTFLPCGTCSVHFYQTLRETHPLDEAAVSSRDSLSRWMVDVHNAVNQRLGKATVDYDRVAHFYLKNGHVPLRDTDKVLVAPRTLRLLCWLKRALGVAVLVIVVLAAVLAWRLARRGR